MSNNSILKQIETQPLLSVGIITYNQEAYIEQCLESILAQKTTFNFEIVIGEDVSKDSTRAICEKYVAQYPDKIRVLDTPHNFGGVGNLLRTIEACKGRYVALLEGDDYWIDDKKLQKQVDKLGNDAQMTICFTGRKNFEERSGQFIFTDDDSADNRFYLEDFAKNTYFHTSTVVFRKPIDFTIFNKLSAFKIGDRPLYIALLAESGGYAYKLKDVCSVFRINYSSSFTPTQPFERNLLVAKMFEQLSELYPQLRVYFNHHLNVADYFILREELKNNNKIEVKKLVKQILKRPTTSWGWKLKCKTALHYFI